MKLFNFPNSWDLHSKFLCASLLKSRYWTWKKRHLILVIWIDDTQIYS